MSERQADDGAAMPEAKAAAVREAKGSVHQAIGKLIGDDAAAAQGAAERQTAAQDAKKDPRPRR